MITFRLHRSGVILAAVLALLFAVLIFFAGYLTATVRQRPETRPAPPPAAQPSASPAAPAKTAAPAAAALTIRVGIFATEAEAKALAEKLAAGKIDTRIVPLQTADGTTLQQVLTGRYATRAEASREMSQIEQKEGVSAAVIPVPEP